MEHQRVHITTHLADLPPTEDVKDNVNEEECKTCEKDKNSTYIHVLHNMCTYMIHVWPHVPVHTYMSHT